MGWAAKSVYGVLLLDDVSTGIQVALVELEATPSEPLLPSVRFRLRVLSTSNTICNYSASMSDGIVRPVAAGYDRHTYDPLTANPRITLPSTKP